MHCMARIQVVVDQKHVELMTFHIFNSPLHPLIFGIPWFQRHNSHIDWTMGNILRWGEGCTQSCLSKEEDLTTQSKSGRLTAVLSLTGPQTSASPDADFPDLSQVPQCYMDLKEVFNKTCATSLPPHRAYNCAIDFVPGVTIPKGRLYSHSAPEGEAMSNFINSSLQAGLIRPSSPLAGAWFFFLGKKDGTMCPCIDYSPLNDITIKNRYPTLSPSFPRPLQRAKIFTKLDLQNAYD